jgi:hypothetical protein
MTFPRILLVVTALLFIVSPVVAQGRGAARASKVTAAKGANPGKRTAKSPSVKNGRDKHPGSKGAGRPDTAGNAESHGPADNNTGKRENPGNRHGDANGNGHNRGGRPDDKEQPEGGDQADNDDHGRKGDNPAERSWMDRLAANPRQRARLEAMLPPSMSLQQATSDFRNQGQFIAALNASKNQHISFTDLKTEMTGPNQLSLGQAIKKLRPATTNASTTTSPTGSTGSAQ